MKAQDLMNKARKEFARDFMAAIDKGDEAALTDAVAKLSLDIQTALLEEAADTRQDATVLASRGVRVLTGAETQYYQSLIQAMSAADVKQAIANLDKAMPETVIDAVMEDIASQFPLLEAIDFRNTTAIAKWLYNTQGVQQAVWGALGSKITKELEGSIGEIDLTQCKLTAYMVVSKDFLALGPVWLDRYVRAVLAEANGLALETAIVDGDGDEKPIGMTRDLERGTTKEGATTYEQKEAVTVAEFSPAVYGALVAKLAVSPSGRQRAVREVLMVVNPKDYLTKIMPATTILTPQGTYVSDVLPFPTRIEQSVGVPENKAVLGLANRYFAGMGTSKRGLIEYSDHAQFLEDNRVYTTRLYGNGRPLDNKAFLLLDITNLEAPVSNVRVKGTVATKGETAAAG